MDRRMDGRNPYGSRGGYVSSRRMKRSRRDMGMMTDGHYRVRPMYGHTEYSGRYDDMPTDPHYGEMRGEYEHGGQHRRGVARGAYSGMRGGHRDYGYEPTDYDCDDCYDYGYDYGSDRLSEKDLTEWMHELMNELDHEEKEVFKKERALQRAKDMGIEFSKYSEMEFYVAFLMCYTDFKKTIGKGNMEYALSLAREWLEDKDAPVKYGEKLALYYDYIVCAE